MFSRIVSGTIGLTLLLYGVFCATAQPNALDFIGYQTANADAQIEFLAMYGGVQIGVGVFALTAAFNSDYTKATCLLLTIIFFLLAASRFIGIVIYGDYGDYTIIGVVFEVIAAIMSYIAYRKILHAKL